MIYNKASQIILNGINPTQEITTDKPAISFEEIISNKLKKAHKEGNVSLNGKNIEFSLKVGENYQFLKIVRKRQFFPYKEYSILKNQFNFKVRIKLNRPIWLFFEDIGYDKKYYEASASQRLTMRLENHS